MSFSSNKLMCAFCGFSELSTYKVHVHLTDTCLKPWPVFAGSNRDWMFLHMHLLSCTVRVKLLLCGLLYGLARSALELSGQSWAGGVCKI